MVSKVKQWMEYRQAIRGVKKKMNRAKQGMYYATTTENLTTYVFFHKQYRKELADIKKAYKDKKTHQGGGR